MLFFEYGWHVVMGAGSDLSGFAFLLGVFVVAGFEFSNMHFLHAWPSPSEPHQLGWAIPL